jgi:ubiquinone/menaquinone biosynthesis C-methylase UbiE
MAVHFKRKQADKTSNLTTMQLAIRERQNRERWLAHIAGLLQRANGALVLEMPQPPAMLTADTQDAYDRAVSRWAAECRAVIKAARESGKQYYWNNWQEEGKLLMTSNRCHAA